MTTAADLLKIQKSLQNSTVEDNVEKLINKIKQQIEIDPTIRSYFVYEYEITDKMIDLLKNNGYQIISGWSRETKNNWDCISGYDIRW